MGAEPVLVAGGYTVTFDTELFAYTTEGFKYTAALQKFDIKTDARGSEIIDMIYSGHIWAAEFIGIEFNATKLAKWMPETEGALDIGTLLKSQAKTTKFTPLVTGQQEYTFHKGFPIGDKEFLMKLSEERRLPFLFAFFPDFTKTSGTEYMTHAATT